MVFAVPARGGGRVKQAGGFKGKGRRETEKLRPWIQDYMRHSAISIYHAPAHARGRSRGGGRQLPERNLSSLPRIGQGNGGERVLKPHAGSGQKRNREVSGQVAA